MDGEVDESKQNNTYLQLQPSWCYAKNFRDGSKASVWSIAKLCLDLPFTFQEWKTNPLIFIGRTTDMQQGSRTLRHKETARTSKMATVQLECKLRAAGSLTSKEPSVCCEVGVLGRVACDQVPCAILLDWP
eukprot:1694048-Amphidinium_carterae.1